MIPGPHTGATSGPAFFSAYPHHLYTNSQTTALPPSVSLPGVMCYPAGTSAGLASLVRGGGGGASSPVSQAQVFLHHGSRLEPTLRSSAHAPSAARAPASLQQQQLQAFYLRQYLAQQMLFSSQFPYFYRQASPSGLPHPSAQYPRYFPPSGGVVTPWLSYPPHQQDVGLGGPLRDLCTSSFSSPSPSSLAPPPVASSAPPPLSSSGLSHITNSQATRDFSPSLSSPSSSSLSSGTTAVSATHNTNKNLGTTTPPTSNLGVGSSSSPTSDLGGGGGEWAAVPVGGVEGGGSACGYYEPSWGRRSARAGRRRRLLRRCLFFTKSCIG